jgi:two-component system, NtrC family, response regulator GlrR
LLPVLRAEAPAEVLDELLPWAKDFLVTPLREAEVRVRARRIAQPGAHPADRGPARQLNQAFSLAQLVGEAPAFHALKRKISLAAQFESAVFLSGETGTGKERCARALHYLSRRASKPFIPVNCGAVPADLFESEIYGHQKGAFTGAISTQPGLIAEAEGGTLFLDEVETLSLSSQVKLLRFLQDQTYHALGCANLKQADVWIIASANVDLLQKAKAGDFREDLFYRLAVITLDLPPLRQRRADIPLLAAHFLKLHGDKHGKDRKRFSQEATEALCGYSWPGNIRELENVVQQVIVFTESQIVEPKDIPIPRNFSTPAPGDRCFKHSKARIIDEFERTYVADLLASHKGNVTHAALTAKMDRRAFGRLVRKYQIEKPF